MLAAGALSRCGSKSNPGPGTGPTPVADPPSISCPVDLSVTGVTGTTQTITYTAPTVTAGTTPLAVTCSPSSGAAFPLGGTTVRCMAIDAGARQASCNFTVTLKGFKIGVTKYLAFGDSVTEGQNGLPFGIDFIDVPNAYPTKLQVLLESSFPGQGITVSNRGKGGERVEEAVAPDRLPAILAQERPGAVLLIDGYNNLLAECGERDHGTVITPLCVGQMDLVAGKMREMVRMARAAGATSVFVGTLTPPGPWEGNISNRRITPGAITQMNAKLRTQIPGEGAVIVDIYPLFLGHEAEYTGPDGLHIDPPGNQAIAGAFFAAIKAAIPQTPAFGVAR